MATFSQHHVDGLDLALTPLQYMLKCFPLTKDQEQRYGLSALWGGHYHGIAWQLVCECASLRQA